MSEPMNDGGPAFPIQTITNANGDVQPGANGMTLRDYFASKILQGFCANPAVFAPHSMRGWGLVNTEESDLAAYSYSIADAMLAERSKKP